MGDLLRGLLKGAIGPSDNDSRYLLDVHSRQLPGEDTMRRYEPDDEVDLVIVGAGAGGSVLAQRLARHGWRIVLLEAGPFWHPDEDWVSDEAGSHELYWTQKRIIGGDDPIELGKNNSGRGVGGSMVHYAGYTPRFHPSDFSTATDDGVGADWPIAYEDLRPHYERVEAELPVSGQNWPWGHPHRYPFSPHPISGAASKIWEGARRLGIEMRVGPVGIVNGTFGNRPHCIYRGYCLQGCKVNAKASPYVTHLPDALAHAVEIRSTCMATRIELDATGRATGVVYHDEVGGAEKLQRARFVAVAGYSIETPRLPPQLHLGPVPPRALQQRGPGGSLHHGAGREPDRRPVSGRAAHVQGATPGSVLGAVLRDGFQSWVQAGVLDPDRPPRSRSAGPSTSWPTDIGVERCGSTCATTTTGPPSGCSTSYSPNQRTGSPSPMRTDPYGIPVARMDYSLCENDKTNIAYSTKVITDIWNAAGAQDVLTIHRYAHLVGGARMGSSPETSVIDANQRTWAVPNLFISDGSVCPTQGSANPALTIMAMASRLAARMVSGDAMDDDPTSRSGVSTSRTPHRQAT